MHVEQLWRHPVKSFQGQRVASVVVDADGVRGDRHWGVRDVGTGRVLTGRREPRLLHATARLVGDEPELALPTGAVVRGTGPVTDEALSDWLGAAVTFVDAASGPAGRAEFFTDPTDDASAPVEWTMPAGRFVDAAPLLLVSTATLRWGATVHPDGDWDVRRFRPNLVVEAGDEPFVEDGWCGQVVRVGEVEVVPLEPCVRCTMVIRAQPGLDRDTDVYRTIARHHAGTLGVWATVQATGTVHAGDEVSLA